MLAAQNHSCLCVGDLSNGKFASWLTDANLVVAAGEFCGQS